MNVNQIDHAVRLATQFIVAANNLRNYEALNHEDFVKNLGFPSKSKSAAWKDFSITGSKRSGQLRRTSLDLSAALTEMRR